MATTKIFAILLLACSVGCAAALSERDKQSLKNAQLFDLYIYMDSDRGGEKALAKSSFCSTDAVLQRVDAGAGNGGPIKCEE